MADSRRGSAGHWLLAAGLVLAGCSTGPEQQPGGAPASTSRAWPEFDYAAAAPDHVVYRIDPDASQVEVVVRRAGPLARFGHDHVLVVRELEGHLLWDAADAGSRAELRFPAAKLEVDPPAARTRHGLGTEPDAEAIAGTSENLQVRVLESGDWPWVELALGDIRPRGDGWEAQGTVTVRGAAAAGAWRFTMSLDANHVAVQGRQELRQTELGLTPFAVMGGGLRVADTMEIHYRLQGFRVRNP